MKHFDAASAARFAKLALDCVHREYPNKIAYVYSSDADVRSARQATPAFYGCYDWHSAVHSHWLLARVARLFPQEPFAVEARAAIDRNITEETIAGELRSFAAPQNGAFERPYGLAWLLTLSAELRLLDPALAEILSPLENAVIERLSAWLPKLAKPVRSGEHSNTAFAMGLALDAARASGHDDFAALLKSRARDFYFWDCGCPIAWEPSGEDFLSPCLAEADLMRRIFDPHDFLYWFEAFVSDLSRVEPVQSPDPSDPKFSHLDGLNLSRAWMLEGIANGLPESNRRVASLGALAKAHAEAGLAGISGEHYEGTHWLGTFAVYFLTL